MCPTTPAPLPNTPRNNLYRAVAQVGLGNNVEAGLPVLARLLEEMKPPEAEFYMVLGDGWKSFGDNAQAAAAYRRALQMAPGLTRAMRALATVDEARAAEILRRAVQVAPDDAESWFRLGVLTSSAEYLQRAIGLDPWLPNQSRRLAEVTQSEAALKDALRTDPFDDAAWDVGGRIFAGKGDLMGARFYFERAVKLNSSSRYLYDYALALVRANLFDEALAKAEAAVHAEPEFSDAHELLGGLYTKHKRLTDAVREYQTALSLSPGSARLELRLGIALAATGDRTGAASHLRSAASAADAAISRQAEQALRELGNR
ncbi:MAG: tetratricopeptide repeat protein [Ignavibacteriota bacterium]